MSKTVEIAGVDVHIEGDGAETIVMIHGWPDTYRLWDGQVAHFKSRYRCVRFTLPGFEAGSVRRLFSVSELSEIFRQIVEQVNGGRPVILMLHDWGCFFGGQFAMRHPGLVSKIVSVDVGDPVSLRRALTLRSMALIGSYQLMLALAWRIGGRFGAAVNRGMARGLGYRLDTSGIHANMAYPYWLVLFGSRRPQNRALAVQPECPMFYIYARRKPAMFQAESWLDWLRALPRNAVMAFDTGHWVMVQQPERFNQVVGDWLQAPPA